MIIFLKKIIRNIYFSPKINWLLTAVPLYLNFTG